jgi:hypothetical protein
MIVAWISIAFAGASLLVLVLMCALIRSGQVEDRVISEELWSEYLEQIREIRDLPEVEEKT